MDRMSSTLVDPTICPDCRAPLGGDAVCTGCGLRLAGPLATDLWRTMQAADALIQRLRAEPAGVASASSPTGALPSAPPIPPRRPPARTSLPSASVPVVLLTLGALCLLVAAVVFVAVAWSSLSLAAKSTILLALTGLLAAGAAAVTRRGLRGAAETLWVVVAGMLVVDLVSAVAADLAGLGVLTERDKAVLVGLALLGLSIVVGLWSVSTPLRTVHAMTGVAAVGAVTLTSGAAWSYESAAGTAISVPVLALGGLLLTRVLPHQGWAVASVAVLSWLALLIYGTDATYPQEGSIWWTGPQGWPFLAAALLAAIVTLPLAQRLAPSVVGYAAGGGALLALALFVLGPDGDPTPDVLQSSAAALGLALVALVAPTRAVPTTPAPDTWALWARPAAVLSGLAGLLTATLAIERITDAAEGITDFPEFTPAPWTAPILAVVLVATGAAVVRQLRPTPVHEDARALLVALAPGTLIGGAALWTAEAGAAPGVVTTTWALTAAAFLGGALVTRHRVAAATAAVAASHLAVLVALWMTGDGHDPMGVWLAGFAGGVLIGALLLSLPALGDRGLPRVSRMAIEGTALFFGTVAVLIPRTESVTAMAATLIGTAIALVGAVSRDRWWAGWLAVPYLAAAMIVRVDAGARPPEAYTLPAAAILLVAGTYRMVSDSRAESLRALGSGLTLALAPSLLLSLDDPVSLRGLLIGLAGLAAVALGAGLRWASPLVAGAITVAALAVAHLWPVAEAIPRWITLGGVGAVLLLVGITWEARLRNLRSMRDHLVALR